MTRVAQTRPEDDPESSVDLLLKAQAGDEEARNDLLGRYLPRLERWASGRLPLGVRTMLDTGDIVQEAVINALPRLNTLEVRTEKAFEAYLKRAIKNRIIDVYRRPRRQKVEPGEDLPARVARNEEQDDGQVGQRLGHIVMHAELGFDNSEIATELGKSTDAARMALGRALKRLAAEM